MSILEQMLKQDEGKRLIIYDDANDHEIVPGYTVKGHPTIGYGRALDTEGITDDEAQMLLSNDIARFTAALQKALPWLSDMDEPRVAAVQNMGFELGVAGLLKFKRTLAALQAGKWQEAHDAMLMSPWALNQAPDRAQRLAKVILKGNLASYSIPDGDVVKV